MAQIHKLEGEFVAKYHAAKLYNMMTSGAPSLPKYLPHIIHKCQVLPEYGEIRLGSVFVWDYIIEGNSSTVTTKEKVTAVDHKNMSITCTVFEGDLTIGYPSFALTLHVTPILGGGSNKSTVKWSMEYEKENEHVPTPTPFLEFLETFFKELDVKLLEESQKGLISK
ncbi:MLP-like protein 43 isoform X2 [Papaver somniferum]|uniref:MLP-like protein 43 isoform X2 n=1 Tax=Papaver somniferum TaxID=3469 RepID=UPI000E6FF6B0|nr:MLP-like protein 43 isoform X2 [Papaver somniferum]